MITIAARLCRNAGYHQDDSYHSSLTESERQNRRWIFWNLYAFDHAMSLNLGQAANIPDFDLTVAIPDTVDSNDVVWRQLWLWVKMGKIQGKIYEELYSGSAQHADPQTKTACARALAQELIALHDASRVSMHCPGRGHSADTDSPRASSSSPCSIKVEPWPSCASCSTPP